MRISRRNLSVAVPGALVLALAALLGRVGADARWLAAVGRLIVRQGSVPAGIPFASVPTQHWPNVPVLAEIVFGALERGLGDRGLFLAQLLAAGAALAVLARDARAAGGSPGATGTALLLAGLGALASLAIARVQMFSLVLFPLLLALLRAESRRPSGRIWLVLPLLALWSNLHGAAVLGLGVVIAYLLIDRLRHERARTAAVLVCAPLALCLTPALTATPRYYEGLLTNVAAQTGQGMWAPLSLTSPLDIALVLAGAILLGRARRSGWRAWEVAVAAGLAVATVEASRDGVWLLFLLVPPASAATLRGRRTVGSHGATRPIPPPLLAAAGALAAIVLAFALVRGPASQGASSPLVERALALAHGTPVLAGDGVDEQIALAGGRIWMGDPIDAFPRQDQAVYLDWLEGRPAGAAALSESAARVALVAVGSRAQTLMARTPGFTAGGSDSGVILYVRAS